MVLISPEGFSQLSDNSIKWENDSVFTIDSVVNELSADGEWIKVKEDEIDSESVSGGTAELDDDINTEYVWRPYGVGPDWSPYTNGYWTYTSCGWMWVSNYHWGWRPYHYGRWWWSPIWGWVWSPGFVWAPAWVVWMFYDGYCGWYPLSPRVRWHRHHGYHCHHVRFRVRHWTFCDSKSFAGVVIDNTVIIAPEKNKEILRYSKFASNIEVSDKKVVNKGPDVREIEKAADKKFVARDVDKYNNTKQVNISRKQDGYDKEVNEKQAYREGQKKQDERTYENKREYKEEKQNKQNESYREKPPDNWNRKENDNKRTEEKKREDNTRKNQEYRYDPPPDNDNKQDNYKQEKKSDNPVKHDPPPQNNPPKRNDDNNSKRDDGNKKDEGSKQNRN
jgi:hypothetical protein